MPIDLSTELLGLRLRNPPILGSGEMSNSGARLQEAAQAGFGAVVTKTIGPPKGPLLPPTSPRRKNEESSGNKLARWSECACPVGAFPFHLR